MSLTGIQNNNNIIYLPHDTTLNLEKGLAENLFEALKEHGDKIAQIDSETSKQETYIEFFGRIIALAQALKTKGIKPNDIVVYCCANNMDYVVVLVASIFIGAKFSCYDNILDPDEMSYCMNIVTPSIIFCDEQAEKLIESGLEGAGVSCDIIGFTDSEKYISMAKFVEKYTSDEEFKIYKNGKLKDTCGIVFTSGTSGNYKGAEITGYGLYYSALTAGRCVPNITTTMVFTLTSWISNISFVVMTLVKGNTRIIYRTFNKETIIKVLFEYKVNLVILTQFMINILMKFPECCNYDTSSVKYVMYGGSMIGENTLSFIKQIFPNAGLVNCFGMTEMSGIVFDCPSDKDYFDAFGRHTAGRPSPGIYYQVTDLSTEKALGPNEQGELRIKYEGFMNGYFKNPEKTAEVLDENGYFRTGDIAYYDDNYLFYIVDRLKEIFMYEGKHISLSVIEDHLQQHPAVKEVAVVTIPHEKGEVPVACIVLREGATATEEEFVKYIEEKLTNMYHLRGGVRFVDCIPKSGRGKVKRKALKEESLKDMQKK